MLMHRMRQHETVAGEPARIEALEMEPAEKGSQDATGERPWRDRSERRERPPGPVDLRDVSPRHLAGQIVRSRHDEAVARAA